MLIAFPYVYNIPLCFVSQRDSPPIIPTDTSQGYKQMRAKIGRSKVRPWKWMPFTNPARKVNEYISYSEVTSNNFYRVNIFTCCEKDAHSMRIKIQISRN